jgi:hypothetical protein
MNAGDGLLTSSRGVMPAKCFGLGVAPREAGSFARPVGCGGDTQFTTLRVEPWATLFIAVGVLEVVGEALGCRP